MIAFFAGISIRSKSLSGKFWRFCFMKQQKTTKYLSYYAVNQNYIKYPVFFVQLSNFDLRRGYIVSRF